MGTLNKKALLLILLSGILIFGGVYFFLKYQRDQKALNHTPTINFNSSTVSSDLLMGTDSYHPKDITVKVGSRVNFRNVTSSPRWPASDLHPTHGIYPEFDPQKEIGPNEEWSFTFDKAGKWRYHDHLIPDIKGTITVIE